MAVRKKIDHSNPFNKGVTYKSFLECIKDKKVSDVLKKHECTKEQIDWIETELETYKKNK